MTQQTHKTPEKMTNNSTTDTPRTDACPHCGAEERPYSITIREYNCETLIGKMGGAIKRSELCRERERHQDALLRYSEELAASKAEVERLRGLLNAHAEFLIKNGFYRESRDLMGGSWSDGFVALAKKCGINPCDQ